MLPILTIVNFNITIPAILKIPAYLCGDVFTMAEKVEVQSLKSKLL